MTTARVGDVTSWAAMTRSARVAFPTGAAVAMAAREARATREAKVFIVV